MKPEAAAIAEILSIPPERCLVDPHSADDVAVLMQAVNVLHYAGHAQPNALHAGGRPITLEEIIAKSLNVRLVVVNGCDSGAGASSSDGPLSLQRAFLHAGARSVVASLWRVSDDTAVVLMYEFYRRLKAGQPLSVCLQEAMCILIRRGRHVCDWAALTLFGSDCHFVNM